MTASDPPSVLTTADVALLAGVETRTIHRYRSRGSVPNPDGYLGSTPWWHVETITRWLETRPKRGRPKSS